MDFFSRIKKLIRFVLFTLISIGTLVLISGTPYLLSAPGGSWSVYFDGLGYMIRSLFLPGEIIFINAQGKPVFLFPYVWEPFVRTFSLLIASFAISFFAAIGISLSIQLLPSRLKKLSTELVSFTQSLPDIFIVVSVQFLVIWWYQQSGVLLSAVASSSHSSALLLPLISLSILPTALMARLLLLNFSEAADQPYTEYALAKGLSKFDVLYRHILRNTLFSLFTNARTIIWALLSNILMVEYLFNINGVTLFIINYSNPELFNVLMILIFLPLYLLFAFFKRTLFKITGEAL